MNGGPGGSEELAAIQPKLASRAASGALWIGLEMAGSQVTSLLVFAIMARFINPSDFGLISISYLAIFGFKSLVIDSVVFAVIRKKQASDIEYTTAFWLTVAFATIASLVIFMSAGIAERLMRAPGLKDVVQAMSLILFFMGLARTHEMRLARFFQFRALALRAVAGAILGGGIGIVLATLGYGLTALVIQQIATSGISLALLWAASSWRPSFQASKVSANEILTFMRSMVPTSVISIINQNCDVFLVAYFFGPANAGLYAVAKRLRGALQSITGTPVNAVALSALAEVQVDRKRLANVARQMIAMISFICAPIFVGSSSLSHEVVSLAFGPRWSDASPIFEVLAVSGFFIVLQSFTDSVYTLKNKQLWSFYNQLVYTTLAVLLFFVFRGRGAEFIALAFVLPYLVVFPISALLASRLIELSFLEWSSAIAPAVASSCVMFVVIKVVGTSIPFIGLAPRIAAICILGAIVYLPMMLVLGRSTVLGTFRVLRGLLARR
jgi:O-antigen/teichoic acid export membrane protein